MKNSTSDEWAALTSHFRRENLKDSISRAAGPLIFYFTALEQEIGLEDGQWKTLPIKAFELLLFGLSRSNCLLYHFGFSPEETEWHFAFFFKDIDIIVIYKNTKFIANFNLLGKTSSCATSTFPDTGFNNMPIKGSVILNTWLIPHMYILVVMKTPVQTISSE